MAEQVDIQKSNKALIITGIVIAFLVIGLVTNGFGISKLITGSVVNPQGGTSLEIGNSPVIGDPSAPVTIYEFTDFSCPYCQRFALQTLPQIEEQYIKTGKVKIVFKYFPGHGGAKAAHLVALAMNSQGLFEKFHNAAFIAPTEDLNDMNKMKVLAESLGADMTKLNEDLNNNNYAVQLTADTAMGQSAGIKGTPSFIINGKMIEGAQPLSEFQKVIDKAL